MALLPEIQNFLSTNRQECRQVFNLTVEAPLDYTSKEFIHSFLQVNGFNIHLVSHEKNDQSKPLLLFLHGFPESWYSWRNQLKEFSKDFNAVAIDLPGYGLSSHVQSPSQVTEQQLTTTVKEIIHSFGYEKCHLVCHDWGGILGWSFAQIYPQLLDSLILINTLNSRDYKTNMTFSQFCKSFYMYFCQIPLLPHLVSKMDSIWVREIYRSLSTVSLSEMDVFRENYEKNYSDFDSVLCYYRSLFNGGWGKVGDIAPALKVRTLGIWGIHDQLIDKDVCFKSLMENPNVSVVEIDGAGHFCHQDAPKQVNSVMRNFFSVFM